MSKRAGHGRIHPCPSAFIRGFVCSQRVKPPRRKNMTHISSKRRRPMRTFQTGQIRYFSFRRLQRPPHDLIFRAVREVEALGTRNWSPPNLCREPCCELCRCGYFFLTKARRHGGEHRIENEPRLGECVGQMPLGIRSRRRSRRPPTLTRRPCSDTRDYLPLPASA